MKDAVNRQTQTAEPEDTSTRAPSSIKDASAPSETPSAPDSPAATSEKRSDTTVGTPSPAPQATSPAQNSACVADDVSPQTASLAQNSNSMKNQIPEATPTEAKGTTPPPSGPSGSRASAPSGSAASAPSDTLASGPSHSAASAPSNSVASVPSDSVASNSTPAHLSAPLPGSDYVNILSQVNTPADLKGLSDADLRTLADELRAATIDAVSKTGGHLGAGLGVVELTVAIHAVFDTPDDRLIWDVGHQCYPHKILTGRKDRIETLRKGGGLSGFTKRSESEYDPFGAGHSSTSISAAMGMSVAADLKKNMRRKPEGDSPEANHPQKSNDKHVIAVIGDGAMSAGMAYEAMNNAGENKNRLIVILNDNEMSIAPPVGAMSKYLTKLVSKKGYINAREMGKKIVDHLPSPIRHAAKRAEEGARVAIGGGSLFEEMGFYYIGPVDGHDLSQLLPILRNLKASGDYGPVLIHARTEKGKGYSPAESSPSRLHAVKKFDVDTGVQAKSAPSAPSYTSVFADQLIEEAEKDPAIVAIHAAMPDGTGLDKFEQAFPTRTFDVGIAEQHAVTFAAGMAAEGLKPFVAIYSTFLQRAYDQIVHDVAIQNLPVRFMIDRAGLVGADGATHAGSFDIAYLSCLPNMTLMAASDADELRKIVSFSAGFDKGPIALRYPRGESVSLNLPAPDIELGKGRIVYSTVIPASGAAASNGGDPEKRIPAQGGHDIKERGITYQSPPPSLHGQNTFESVQSMDHTHPSKEGACDDDSIAILSYGTRLEEALKAAKALEAKGKAVTVADARFAKPLDEALISQLASAHAQLITIEEGSSGGFGASVLTYLANNDLLGGLKLRTLTLPDRFQDHDDPAKQYEEAALTAADILGHYEDI